MRIVAALVALITGALCIHAIISTRRVPRRHPLDAQTIIALLRARDRARLEFRLQAGTSDIITRRMPKDL